MKNKKYTEKIITLDDLSKLIRPGYRIFLSSGSATPTKTVSYLCSASHVNFSDLEFIQLASLGDLLTTINQSYSNLRLKTFNVGENIGKNLTDDKMDFIPTSIAELPYLFVSGAVGIDVAIVQTSMPDNRGNLNLGVVNDLADIIIQNADVVIAETNPNVPMTRGTTSVPIDKFTHIIESDVPLIEFEVRPIDEITDRIAWYASNLIEDGSTVALSAGKIFDAISKQLTKKKNLAICSHVISDWAIGLVESGALAQKKLFDRKAMVSVTSCIGTNELYRYVHNNSSFNFIPLLHSKYQADILKINKLVGILNIKKIDISGDLVLIHKNDYQVSGFDGKLNFALAAAHSRDGKVMATLKSTDKQGKSNIVISHAGTKNIRSALGSIRYVVTEYGVANIFGKTVKERAIALIDIAHPKHRKALLQQAKEAGYIYLDQIYDTRNAMNYPYSLETIKRFKKHEIRFRPIKPSDEDMMRRFFYNVSTEGIYMRYFSHIRAMPHEKMQRYVNIDYEKILSIVGIIQHRGIERIVAEARYACYIGEDAYELAFMVDEEFQGMGIGSFLFDYLLTIAQARGIKKMDSYVLHDNKKMSAIFSNARIKPRIFEEKYEKHYIFYIDDQLAIINEMA